MAKFGELHTAEKSLFEDVLEGTHFYGLKKIGIHSDEFVVYESTARKDLPSQDIIILNSRLFSEMLIPTSTSVSL